MGVSKGYEHVNRPKLGTTWCGMPWRPADAGRRGTRGKFEVCPDCRRRSRKGM